MYQLSVYQNNNNINIPFPKKCIYCSKESVDSYSIKLNLKDKRVGFQNNNSKTGTKIIVPFCDEHLKLNGRISLFQRRLTIVLSLLFFVLLLVNYVQYESGIDYVFALAKSIIGAVFLSILFAHIAFRIISAFYSPFRDYPIGFINGTLGLRVKYDNSAKKLNFKLKSKNL